MLATLNSQRKMVCDVFIFGGKVIYKDFFRKKRSNTVKDSGRIEEFEVKIFELNVASSKSSDVIRARFVTLEDSS